MPTVLTIAGVDPSGGAGIQVDLEAFAAAGVRACTAVAALTAQNDRRVHGVFLVTPAFITSQIESVFEMGDVHAVKVGMLGSAQNVHAVAATLQLVGARNIVVDPVLCASSGAALLDDAGVVALRELFPIATVITPNAVEAGTLSDRPAPTTVNEMRSVAHALTDRGASWVLVTGGHVDPRGDCVDVLTNKAGRDVELRVARVEGGMRGTGCRLSSAIAAQLARGADVPTACALAQRYVARTIEEKRSRSSALELAV